MEDDEFDPAIPKGPNALYAGVTIGQLSFLFHRDARTITQKIVGRLEPVSYNPSGKPRYDIAAAAALLVKPDGKAVAEAIKTMRPSDLPAYMQKEFWDSMLKRQAWEAKAGALWRTEDVQVALGDVFKTLRMTMLLMADNVARETDLTTKQRDIINALVDDALAEMSDKLLNSETLAAIRTVRESTEIGDEEVEKFVVEVPPLTPQAELEAQAEKTRIFKEKRTRKTPIKEPAPAPKRRAKKVHDISPMDFG